MITQPSPMRSARRCLLIACAGAWIVAFTATHVPPRGIPPVGLKDTTLHAVGFFVLTGLFLLAMASYGVTRVRRTILTLCIMPSYAAFDESTQLLVNRSAAFSDWTADVIGASAALLICEAILAIISRKPQR